MKPTKETYEQLNKAYDFFNETLFDSTLPDCIILLHRKRGALGYFWGETWADNGEKQVIDEIALNPDHLQNRSLKETLSTLVHEMCHLKQHHFGKPSRNGYHNKQWARMMEDVGLIPSTTGDEDGKKTGQKITHYIEQDGLFDKKCNELLAEGFSIPFVALPREKQPKRDKSKLKFTCPSCGLNAWGKHDISLMCGDCQELLESEES